ncbi:NADAR family protein [Streptomyces boninensis]|uniref:NADAR family protein n=1 Tax=Streptomyces boninensis TaxID=2039455 RepID=UPI003B219E60
MVTNSNAVKFLFFWGHRAERDGSVGKGCFSQWWPAPFTVDGVEYATAEHFMMAGKARLFGDAEAAAAIVAAGHPAEAKKLGRTVRRFDEEAWAAHRYELVVRGNEAKFGQHDELRDVLLRTGDRVLVEASPMDRVWGIGLAADDERAQDPKTWRGLNLLGFALMDVRTRLRLNECSQRSV